MTADQHSAPTSPVLRPRRPFVLWDIGLSAVAMSLAAGLVAAGVSGAFSLVTALDRCPTCSPSGVLVSVGGPVVVAIAAGFAGLVLTALRIVDRRPSWPYALATLAVCAVAIGVERAASAGVPGL